MFTIKTNRLILRQWQESDLEPFAALNADPRVREFFPSLLSRQESDHSVQLVSDSIANTGWGFWAASLIDTGEFIGFIGLNTVRFEAPFTPIVIPESEFGKPGAQILPLPRAGQYSKTNITRPRKGQKVGCQGSQNRFWNHDRYTPAVEIGWRLAYKHWGKGYATEGARAALHYGFDTLKLPEIVAFTPVNNLRSRHVMEKIGMQHNPADDFDHPKIPEGHPLRRHVLYRALSIKKDLDTPRLILRSPRMSDIEKLKSFEERNSTHLSPWRSTPPGPKASYQDQLTQSLQDMAENRSIRFFLFLKEHPEGDIIGTCTFSQIFRGPFQACYLGYHIDAAYQGKGLMSEAVERAIQYMFQDQNIHRIMASYMPSNARSAQLLKKLGFTIEGKAEKYLLINGQWEDHVLTSLTNPQWQHIHN